MPIRPRTNHRNGPSIYGPDGCGFCGGYPFHRITCPALRWIVVSAFVGAIVAIGLVAILSLAKVTGFRGVNPYATAALLATAASGLLLYQIMYRRHRRRATDSTATTRSGTEDNPNW